jgi:hypothetical protein
MIFYEIIHLKVLYNFVVHQNIYFVLLVALIISLRKSAETAHLKSEEQHSNNFSPSLVHLFPWPKSTLNTKLVQGREKSNSPWSPTNPRAAGRDGERPIYMGDAPVLAPLAAERGFREGKC